MGGTTSAIRLVDVLAASSTCAIEVQPHILHVEVELSRHFGHHDDDASARVETAFLLRLRNALHFMNAAFMPEVLECVFPRNFEDSRFAALANTHVFLEVNLFPTPPHQTRVVLVHFHQVVGKQT